MTELDDDQIRMRRRLGAVALVYLVRLLSALLISVPIAGALGATGIGHFPEGDALLFAPGATHLVEALRIGAPALLAASQAASIVALVAGAVALVPLAALLVALCHGGRLRLDEWAARAVEHLPAFVLLSGVTLIIQGGVLFVTIVTASAFRNALSERLTERGADVVFVLLLGSGLLVVAALGIVHDLSRAAAVRQRLTGRQALGAGLSSARSLALRALVGWSAPALLSLALVAVAGVLVFMLRVEAPGQLRFVAVVVIHQLAAFAIVALRATWLAAALRIVGPRAERTAITTQPAVASE